MSSARRILYVATDDWFFVSHFLHLAVAARDEGYEVGIAARIDKHADVLRQHGFAVFPLQWDRAANTPLQLCKSFYEVFKTVRTFSPGILHVIALRSALLSLPAILASSGMQAVIAPTGLGIFWIKDTFSSWLGRIAIRLALKMLPEKRTRFVFENSEDAAELHIQKHKSQIIVGGAGIDPAAFSPAPLPPGPLRIAIVSRMLRSKGIETAIAAVKQARQSDPAITLDLYGDPDPANEFSLTASQLNAFSHDGIAWHGATNEVAGVWRHHHVAMLLSAREGLPRCLLEAAACGRAIIASNATGCRTLVRNDIEGLLVEPGNGDAAAAAILRLARNRDLVARYGAAARQRIEKGFTQESVAQSILKFYVDA